MDHQDIFIIQSFGDQLSKVKLLNALMADNACDVICWNNEENAYQYIIKHDLESSFKVTKKELSAFIKELEEINTSHHGLPRFGVKIIDTVEF